MKIINDVQEQELNRIRVALKEFQALRNDSNCDNDLKAILKEYVDEKNGQIPRRLNQFNSSIVTIIAMGMLKAGKSTLVNLLARTENASPTGYGRDTTLRPALIKMADEGDNSIDEGGSIDIYYHSVKDSDRGMGKLLDDIRGVVDVPYSKPTRKRLTLDNLTMALCRPYNEVEFLKNEPLLVVVTIPYNPECKLLMDKRMLLDMPGLDSAQAYVSRSKHPMPPEKETPTVPKENAVSKQSGDEAVSGDTQASVEEQEGTVAQEASDIRKENAVEEERSDYDALVDECDLMLFVQSSVAPLNYEAEGMLKRLIEKRTSSSCYIVQNTMRAKYWRTEENQENDQNEQGRYAVNTIRNLMLRLKRANVSARCDLLNMTSVNLGMAYDGLFDDEENSVLEKKRKLTNGRDINKETLVEVSNFNTLEKNLLDEVDSNACESRYTHCCDELKRVLRSALNKVNYDIKLKTKIFDRAREDHSKCKGKKTETTQLLTREAIPHYPGAVQVVDPPDFASCKTQAKCELGLESKTHVKYSEANEYLHRLDELCKAEAVRFLAESASLENVTFKKGEKGTMVDGVQVCNNAVANAYRCLTEDGNLHEPFPNVNLYWNAAGSLLDINIENIDLFCISVGDAGVRTYIEKEIAKDEKKKQDAMENMYTLPIKRHLGFLYEKKIHVSNALMDLKVGAIITKYENIIEAAIKAHYKSAFEKIIAHGLQEGAAPYMKKLQERIDNHAALRDKWELGLERRIKFRKSLNDFLGILNNLPS